MEFDNNLIIGHIAGLTETTRGKLFTYLKKSKLKNIDVFDVDVITNKIIEDKTMDIIYTKYDYYLDRTKNQDLTQNEIKISQSKVKQLEKKMSQYWKVRMEYYLNKLMMQQKNKVLLIGDLSFFKNPKIYLNLNIVPKFFIKVEMLENASNIIKNNLDNHRDNIINGTFDLNYLDMNFLIKKRMFLQSIYTKINYFIMSMPLIINTLELYTSIELPQALYYASFIEYNKKIPILTNAIFAYSEEWLALSSILTTLNDLNKISDIQIKDIKKWTANNEQFIKLSKIQANKLKENGFIYEIIDTDNFLPYPTKNNLYKFFTVKPIKINRVIKIDNIIEQMKKLNINIIIEN